MIAAIVDVVTGDKQMMMQEEECKAEDSEKQESSGAAGVTRQQVAVTEGVIDIVD